MNQEISKCINTLKEEERNTKKYLELRFIQTVNAACGCYNYFSSSHPEHLYKSNDGHEPLEISSTSLLKTKFTEKYFSTQFNTGYGPLQIFSFKSEEKKTQSEFYAVSQIDDHLLVMLMYQLDICSKDNWQLFNCINAAVGSEYISLSENNCNQERLAYFDNNIVIEYGTLDTTLYCYYEHNKTINTSFGDLHVFQDDNAKTILAIQMELILAEYPRVAYVTVETLDVFCSITK